MPLMDGPEALRRLHERGHLKNTLVILASATVRLDQRKAAQAGLAPGPWYLTVFRTADGHPIQRFLWLKASA